MAKMRDNNATHGIRGKVNQFVYRQRFGETVVSKPPIRVAPYTEEQLEVRSTFKRAAIYAKTVEADAALKAAYKAKAGRNRTAYNMALADYFKAPEIVDVDLSAISSGTISTLATDNFKVKQVTVSIEAADGSLIESGAAVQQPDGMHWVYTTTSANANISGNKVSITATDLPGNSIVNEITI